MLHGRRNTPAKKYILLFLWIIIITIKIKAETTTKTTEITTEMTETLAAIEYTDNQILTADPRDVATSARKRIVVHRDI